MNVTSGGSTTGGASTAGSSGAGGGRIDGSGGAALDACDLPDTVSFQSDLQPFLTTACGGGNGCHVIDGASTMQNGGYNHAYDWITAGAHASSCPETPTPFRFDILLDVLEAAQPDTCSRSRQMPPPDATGAGLREPLTSCQIAAIRAWLDQPRVTQMHRPDDSSPTTPYPMPPFN